jgi:hypothetical protein
MTRKLLPYEYDLIDALGVSKEDYLDFVAQQHIYEDVKEGTALDIRNEGATVAIVLAVVGILAQVASILLMPKPAGVKEGTPQTRDQVLAPRNGFNGSQELAVYGEAVPLVYTNIANNKNGGVRVRTLLLWSAVLSLGNSQFMQLMAAIGASAIKTIDPDRTAFGQLPAKDIALASVWQYYSQNGATQYKHFLAVKASSTTADSDPRYTSNTKYTADLTNVSGDQDGFSQSFSPTTANAVGVNGFIPINADVLVLNDKGEIERQGNNIQFLADGGGFWRGSGDTRPNVPQGSKWKLTIPTTANALLSTDTKGIARQDAQRAAAATVDNGNLFKAGTVIFRVVEVSFGRNNSSIEEGPMTVVMECVRTGKMPTLNYDITHWQVAQGETFAELDKKIAKLERQIDNINAKIKEQQDTLNRNTKIVKRNRGEKLRPFIVSLTAKDKKDIQNAIEQFTINRQPFAEKLEELEGSRKAAIVAPFHTKGLARIQEASYASVTKCNVLDLVIKFSVYRRLNGRANVYGTKQKKYGHSASDNGAKPRTSMFILHYKLNSGNEQTLPYIFCCRGVNEQTSFTFLKLLTPGAPKQFEIRLEPVVDPPSEKKRSSKGFCYLEPLGKLVRLNTADLTGDGNIQVFFNGSTKPSTNYPPVDKSPSDTSEFDLFNYDAFSSSSFSFDQAPEIKINAVNEQIIAPWRQYSEDLYKGLSILSLHLTAGPGTQDVRDTSVYVTEGKLLRPLDVNANAYQNENAINALARSRPSQSSSFAPDIFLDTVLDDINGIGQYASLHSVDVAQLAESKRYCQRNSLFMDGVIADQRPWREFWAEVAPFSLLELGKIGGKETLVPALPYVKSTGRITRAVSITALFNQGNILEDSFKEEFIDYGASVQDVILTLIYRDVERNGVFPRNNSVEVKRTDTQEANAIRESLNISQFVTTRDQAILLGKYLCQLRRFNRRAIEFQTFPTDSFVMPGSFIYVETSNNQWDGIYTGRIEDGGVLNVPVATRIRNGTYNVLTYGSTDGTKSFSNVSVANGVAASLKARAGQLFVLGQSVRNKRVFRVTEVTMEEEGETTIRAVEHPCNSDGLSRIARGLDAYVAGLFTIDGAAE